MHSWGFALREGVFAEGSYGGSTRSCECVRRTSAIIASSRGCLTRREKARQPHPDPSYASHTAARCVAGASPPRGPALAGVS